MTCVQLVILLQNRCRPWESVITQIVKIFQRLKRFSFFRAQDENTVNNIIIVFRRENC